MFFTLLTHANLLNLLVDSNIVCFSNTSSVLNDMMQTNKIFSWSQFSLFQCRAEDGIGGETLQTVEINVNREPIFGQPVPCNPCNVNENDADWELTLTVTDDDNDMLESVFIDSYSYDPDNDPNTVNDVDKTDPNTFTHFQVRAFDI